MDNKLRFQPKIGEGFTCEDIRGRKVPFVICLFLQDAVKVTTVNSGITMEIPNDDWQKYASQGRLYRTKYTNPTPKAGEICGT